MQKGVVGARLCLLWNNVLRFGQYLWRSFLQNQFYPRSLFWLFSSFQKVTAKYCRYQNNIFPVRTWYCHRTSAKLHHNQITQIYWVAPSQQCQSIRCCSYVAFYDRERIRVSDWYKWDNVKLSESCARLEEPQQLFLHFKCFPEENQSYYFYKTFASPFTFNW